MGSKTKGYRLRAFRIENDKVSQPTSGLLEKLRVRLEGSGSVEERRMRLNEDDIRQEEDLICDFNTNNSNIVYGVVLRIAQAGDVQNLPANSKSRITCLNLNMTKGWLMRL
jgi:hypothetical protein